MKIKKRKSRFERREQNTVIILIENSSYGSQLYSMTEKIYNNKAAST